MGRTSLVKHLCAWGRLLPPQRHLGARWSRQRAASLGAAPEFPGNGKNALRGFSARLQKRSEIPALPARGISTGAKLCGDSSDVEVVEGVQLSEESH